MCQLFTCATSLVELNQMMLDFFMDQLPSGRVQIMYLEADAVFFVKYTDTIFAGPFQ